MMKTSDRVIADLMMALGAIENVALRNAHGAIHIILGMAQQAQENANAYRTRNRDGYLVMREEK